MSKKKEGREDGSGGEYNTTSGRRERGGTEMNRAGEKRGTSGRKRRRKTESDEDVHTAEEKERARARTHVRMYTRGGRLAPL